MTAMQQWEYRYWRGTGKAVTGTMILWGREGWELVSVTGFFEYELWFKRPRNPEQTQP